jgi:hypothetical protein
LTPEQLEARRKAWQAPPLKVGIILISIYHVYVILFFFLIYIQPSIYLFIYFIYYHNNIIIKATRGTLYKYIKNVASAAKGCVTDE